MRTRYAVAVSMLAGIGLGAAAVEHIHAQVKAPPPTYYIAEIEVTNFEGYSTEFLPRAEANVRAFGGRILAAGPKVATIEGEPPKSRVFLARFDGIEKVQYWRNSPEAKEIRAIGHRYAKFRAFTVEGLPQ